MNTDQSILNRDKKRRRRILSRDKKKVGIYPKEAHHTVLVSGIRTYAYTLVKSYHFKPIYTHELYGNTQLSNLPVLY